MGKYRDLFTRVPISAQVLREQVAAGAVSPFDLVISTGVVAIGSTLFGFDDRQGYEKGLTIIEAMRECLNPQNPKAILALFDYFQDMFIPCAPSHLTHLGLKVVYGRESTWEEARIRHQALRESGLVPPDEHVFYNYSGVDIKHTVVGLMFIFLHLRGVKAHLGGVLLPLKMLC